MNPIDRFLNGITMYRLMLYALLVIAAAAGLLSALGILGYSFISLAVSAAVLLAAAWLSQQALVRAFAAAPGPSTWIITTLILFLILKPAETAGELALLALAAFLAMASKFILALWNRHLFNPAAVPLVILGLLGNGTAFWWVGSGVLLPVVFVVGALIVRKQRRFHQVWPFLLAALVTYVMTRPGGSDLAGVWRDVIVSGPLVFFATIMLTEPVTSPPALRLRQAYGAIVGILYGLSFHIGPLYSTPELALVMGNLFSYAVSFKRRMAFRLVRTTPQAGGVYEFAFAAPRPLQHIPGQYLEWTLPHPHPDSRGNRRYFTVASAPEEPEVILGVRIDPAHSSSFKRALLALRPGASLWASQLGGDFTLPRDPALPLVFIAGGIGVTPFRSMARHLQATRQRRDVNLFYTALTANGFTFADIFDAAQDIGWRTHYVITGPIIPRGWKGKSGYVTPDMIRGEVQQSAKALYFLSGPSAMVDNYKAMLKKLGVPRRNIRTDYFPGF